jgi:(p)ppGpp synthase/HD superfamily hydrolase
MTKLLNKAKVYVVMFITTKEKHMTTFRPNQNALRNQALQFAVMAHGNQVRKGNEHIPYVFHPVDVANEVIYYSGLPIPELELASVIAILHDTIEDTIVTFEDVREQFGLEIATGVQALSKDESIVCVGDSKRAQLEESLLRLATAPQYVQAVKLADRVSNLKSFPAMWSRDKVTNYLEEAMLIARALGPASEGLDARLRARVAQARVTLSIM